MVGFHQQGRGRILAHGKDGNLDAFFDSPGARARMGPLGARWANWLECPSHRYLGLEDSSQLPPPLPGSLGWAPGPGPGPGPGPENALADSPPLPRM